MKVKTPWILVITLSCASAASSIACATIPPDAVSGSTSAMDDQIGGAEMTSTKVLLVVAISSNGGTSKIAKAMAEVLGARLVSPWQVTADELSDYSLIGFGSGIYDQMHHVSILEFVDGLPSLPGKKAFIFSTSGISRQVTLDHKIDDPHTAIREKLASKDFELAGEYNCAGFNDNSFLKLFGGMNKGKPDLQDIGQAKAFAGELKHLILDPDMSFRAP